MSGDDWFYRWQARQREARADRSLSKAEHRAASWWTPASELYAASAEMRATYQFQTSLRASREADEALPEFYNPIASGRLGGGRLGNLDDAHRRGMLDKNGLYLGTLHGSPMFYTGADHLLTYGRTQSGKGRDVIVPNCAHIERNSIVVVDPKGQNAYATGEYRNRRGLVTEALDPWGKITSNGIRLNPLQIVIDAAKRGTLDIEGFYVAEALLPIVRKGSTEESWTKDGARSFLAMVMEYYALTEPENCTLEILHRVVHRRGVDMRSFLEVLEVCGLPSIEGQAAAFLSVLIDAPKQWEGYAGEMRSALRMYAPGSPLAHVTSATTFDVGQLKREPCGLFLIFPSEKLGAAAPWITLTVSTMIEAVATARGHVRTTFLLDELANLPYISAIPKALKLYAGEGVQLWGFCQGRHSLREVGYSEWIVREFEDQAGVVQMWGVREPSLLRDIELWSGKYGEKIVNKTLNWPHGVTASQTEVVRPVLQVEDIMAIDQREQLLLTGGRIFIAERSPWFENPVWARELNDYRELMFELEGRLMLPPPRR